MVALPICRMESYGALPNGLPIADRMRVLWHTT